METIERDYAPKGVQFYYIYKSLAHPEINGYVSPFTLEERLMHVQEAQRTLGSRITWLCDTMENDLKHALGDMPNSEFVVSPEGRIVRKRAWSRPEQLRKDLEELIGPVENPTTLADLDFKPPKIDSSTGGNVVPRIKLPGRMEPLRVEPIGDSTGRPFYVKLRAEAESDLLRRGQGKLYLGFFLDRLYAVHWNNRAQPIWFDISAPEGVTLSPSTGQGPKIEAPQDKDPREFLVEVAVENGGEPLQLTVHYFACDDAETFCVLIKQQYRIYLDRDRDGGSRRIPGGRTGVFAGGGFLKQILEKDQDGDGKVSKEEIPESIQPFFDQMDANGDGTLDEQELEERAKRFRAGRFGG